MSSYLTFYAVPRRKSKEEPKERLTLSAYSRGSDIYQYFNENMSIAFFSSESDENYTTITPTDISKVLDDVRKDIQRIKNRMMEYDRIMMAKSTDTKSTLESIDEYIETKDWLSELQLCEGMITFLEDIVEETSYSNSSFEEICCNIS